MPPALVVTLAACAASANRVVPVLSTARAPRAVVPPTRPLKVTSALPLPTVRAAVWPAAESTALSKLTALLVVARLTPVSTSTSSWKCWAPVVVMLPPSWVLPGASVVTLAAVTAALNRVVPPLFTTIAPGAPFTAPPTTPMKLTSPAPALTVSGLASPTPPVTWESTVPPKVTALSVVARVSGACSSTASL